MATNVTTDTIEFLSNNLKVSEQYLEDNLARIKRFNEETLPHKRETIAAMNVKKAENGKTLLVYDREPIDPDTAEQVIGLKKKIEAYKVVIDKLEGKDINFNTQYTTDDYLKFFESKEKTSSIRLHHAKSRLVKKKNKLEENKKKNPKKYGSRPEIPDINKEIINEERKLEHWRKAKSIVESM